MATVKPQLIESQLNFPSCPATDPTLNYRPVIGIVSHPGDGANRLNNASDVSYIAASYVKFAEMAGARVIPLIYTEPPEILNQKLNLVNGIIFTGGRTKEGLYFELRSSFKKVMEKNDAGEHFPLLAICLGFELLTMIVPQDNNILEEFSASHQASTVQFVENIKFEGTVFGSLVYHQKGFKKIKICVAFSGCVTSVDRKNKIYVSFSNCLYPITALRAPREFDPARSQTCAQNTGGYVETETSMVEIQTLVSDKLQVVSYKWLSRNFLVSSDSAKRLLQEFVEKHGNGLEVVYSLSGWLKDSPSTYHIKLVSSANLAEAKKEFSDNCSVQVYSVQACIPKDPVALWNAEFVQAEELFRQSLSVDNCLLDNRYWTSI
ncbi:Gamma-glutamyl hydrolase 2 [Datura stramonium]|uniref:DNA polymerase delta subunit 3 n=1 Tax=Datura stramonium TaxID=4076 RepID=A0ABS8TC97_DATST|nr:Gamma-glutamyl hydrolase 2 [Datura stramonium]